MAEWVPSCWILWMIDCWFFCVWSWLRSPELDQPAPRCSVVHLRSLDEIFTMLMPWCHIHDPSSGSSPCPHPDGGWVAPPLIYPLIDGVPGVRCWGLGWGVSFGDTVGSSCRYIGLVKLTGRRFPWEEDAMLTLSPSSSSRWFSISVTGSDVVWSPRISSWTGIMLLLCTGVPVLVPNCHPGQIDLQWASPA